MSGPLRRAVAHVRVDDVAVPLLDDAAAHHVFRVLRVRDGELVTVTDGAGRWRTCRAAGGGLEPEGEVDTADRSANPFSLYVSIPKQNRPEWIVQKATELGADHIVFLHAERSVVRWDDDRAGRHLAKLQTVAAEAAMQSRRVWFPAVAGPRPADAVLRAGVPAAEPGGRPLGPGDRSIAIGPEGGWSDRELALARDTIGLGSHVLRVETAALAACALAGGDHSEQTSISR